MNNNEARKKNLNFMAEKLAENTNTPICTVKKNIMEIAKSVSQKTGISIEEAELTVYKKLTDAFDIKSIENYNETKNEHNNNFILHIIKYSIKNLKNIKNFYFNRLTLSKHF